MEFRILGVLEGFENGMPLSLGGPKQRSVLAMLLLDPNRSVSSDRLVDGLWGDEPPLRAAATLRVYVSNLRKALEPGRGTRAEPSVLLHQQPGYLLAVDPAQIDLFRFERLVSTARALVTAGCMAGAAALFREALGLWHEAPLADLADEPFARYEIPRLEEAHTGAMEDHIDAELALGRDVELLPDLEGLVARNPFRERLQRQLVLALYRAGRQADALAAYQAAREALVEGLGLEPSRELRELEAAILVQDPGLTPEELAPLTADEVSTVLGAVNGELPSPDVIAGVVAEGRVSARRADDALQRAIEHERTASFTAMLESAGSTSNELVRARHLIADRVLDRRRRPATPSGARGRGVANGAIRGACPYKGLLAFEPEDAVWYFGRERLVAEALATVASTPCTGIVGASGSGKSSLVRAGLLAALSEDALPDSSGWPRLLFTPGADPVLELARALAPRCRAQSADQVRERLLEEPESFSGFAARAVASTSAGASLVVVVDQLEELFTVCRDGALRDRFLDVLVEGATDPDSPTRIVTAIRADYYGRCAAHAGFAALLAQGNVLVGPMTSAELQRAIEIPAARAGLELEAGLIDRIFDDVGTEPGSLPLLETALLETWASREGSTMTLAGYESSGGVRGAVAHLADDVYSHLSEHQRAVARGIFLRLAEPGTGMDDVRRRAPLGELVADDDRAAVLATLVERRLVVANDATAEVAHEALLREWPRLRGWLEEDRAGRRVHRALAIAAQDWIASARDEALLFRGSRLAAAVEVADVHPLEINPVERDFLHASREREEGALTAARRTASRFRSLTVGLAVLLVVAIVAGVFSLVQRSSAERNASRAEQQATASDAARLMATARSMVGEQPDLALLLSLEAHRLDPSLDAETALEAVLASVPAGLERVITFDPEVRYALSSPDGRFIAAPGVDGRVRLLATDTGHVIRTLDGPSDDALVPKMSEDGTLVVAGSLDGLIRVWDAKSGRQLAKPFLAGGDGPAYGWPDPTDPTGVFTVGYDGGVARWNITDPRNPRRDDLFTIGAAEPTRDPAPQLFMVSSDGTKLLAGRSVSGPTWLWDVRRRVQIAVLAGSPAGFDSRGQVVTREGPRVTRWDASTGSQTTSLDTRLASAGLLPALSPDGRYLATSEADTNRVRVLDVDTNADVVAPITLHTSPPIVQFLPDGRLLTMSSERAAIFRIDPFPAPPFARVLRDVAPGFAFFDRSGSRVLTFSATSPVGSWDPASGQRVAEATGQPGPGEQHVVSPDGRTRVILKPGAQQLLLEDLQGNRLGAFPFEFDGHSDWVFWNPDSKRLVLIVDGVPSLWNVANPSTPRMIAELQVKGHADEPGFWLTTAAFSRDGKTTAILRHEAGIATLFDTRTGRRRGVIALERGAMPAAAFSPDGRTLAIVNAGSGVELFDVATGKRRALLSVPNLPNLRGSITFIRDGAAFVTTRVERWAFDDAGAGSLQIWDTATLRPIGVPLPLPGIPYALSSSPDGKRLVHGTTGNFAVVWDVDVASWRRAACDIASRQITRAEWDQYLPGRPYDPSCARTSNR